MRIKIVAKNFPVSENFKEMAQKKLGKLERYLAPETDAQLVVSAMGPNRYSVEVTMPLGSSTLRGEEVADDLFSAVESIVDKLERQIQRHRTKLQKRLRPHAMEDMAPEELPAEDTLQIVRMKRFDLKPMDVEEAILQMDLLGHAFFIFLSSATQKVSVVYKRKDGRYGLIEPQY
jgi:putative sigma-54 modulation protein